MPADLGRPVPPEEANRLARRKTALYHELADGHTEPVPGVVAFIRALAVAGVPRALATSAVADSAAQILEGLGLAGAFTVQVTAGHVRRGKPRTLEVYLTGSSAARCAACYLRRVRGRRGRRRGGPPGRHGGGRAHDRARRRGAARGWRRLDGPGFHRPCVGCARFPLS